MRRFTLADIALAVLTLVLVLPSFAQAQVRGGGHVGGGHAMISAPRTSGYAAPISHSVVGGSTVYRGSGGRVLGTVTSGRRTFSNRSAGRTSTLSAFGPARALPDFANAVPRLGFDHGHRPVGHPVRGGRRYPVVRQGYFPFFDAGFLLPYAPGYLDGSDDASGYDVQPQEVADTSDDDVNAERRTPTYAPQPVSSYDVVVQPQKPSEQYVFVRRDGSLFFAVAYSWEAGNLYYVTQEGVRRSVARDTLDLDATQQFNQQRGLSFQTPAQS